MSQSSNHSVRELPVLPELPVPAAFLHNLPRNDLYTADQMREYGRQCALAASPAPSAGLVAWQDRARDMLHRLNTMQPPNVVLQQITMLGEARSIIEAALAAAPQAQGEGNG